MTNTFTRGAIFLALHLIFFRQSLSLNLKLTDWLKCLAHEPLGPAYLCPPKWGLQIYRYTEMAFLGFGGTGIQVLAYSGHMLYPELHPKSFHKVLY